MVCVSGPANGRFICAICSIWQPQHSGWTCHSSYARDAVRPCSSKCAGAAPCQYSQRCLAESMRSSRDCCSLSYHICMSHLAVYCDPGICMLMACRAGLKASQFVLTGYSLLMRLQELSSPVRPYKMLSLRHMFRTRGLTTENLQKAFFRTSDADADVA